MTKFFKYYFIILITIIVENNVYSQLIPYNNQYYFNQFLINPALTGIENRSTFTLTSHSQWHGIDDSPQMQTFSFNSRIKSKAIYDHTGKKIGKRNFLRTGKYGIGLHIFTDNYEPFRRNGLSFSMSYHHNFNNNKCLSIGLSATLYQFNVNESSLHPINYDPVITNKSETVFTPNGSFGLVYQYKNFISGFSVIQLIPLKVSFNKSEGETIKPQNYLYSGYKYEISQNFSIFPALFIKNTPKQIDFILTADIFKLVSYSILYHTNESVVSFIKINLNQFSIGYSYDYTFSDISKYTNSSHLLLISYDIRRNKPVYNPLLKKR